MMTFLNPLVVLAPKLLLSLVLTFGVRVCVDSGFGVLHFVNRESSTEAGAAGRALGGRFKILNTEPGGRGQSSGRIGIKVRARGTSKGERGPKASHGATFWSW